MTNTPQFETKRILNEGTREPFVARLWVGMMELREQAINLQGGHAEKRTEKRKEFDARYIPILEALQTGREAAREVVSLLAAHRSRLAAGDIVERSGNLVSFTETIDRDLHQATTSLLVNGVIAMSRAQNVAALFDLHIGSFFEKLSKFEQGMLCDSGSPSSSERWWRHRRSPVSATRKCKSSIARPFPAPSVLQRTPETPRGYAVRIRC